MRKPKEEKKKRPTLFAAVVYSEINGVQSMRRDTSYSCFVDTTAEKASKRALQAAAAWEFNTDYGPYVILVGQLSQCARVRVRLEASNERV